jgi:hypothetical protein
MKHAIQYRNIPKQKEKIHKFIQKNSFLIVILDSCRYDYFQREINSHLSGNLNKVYTPATATINYVQTIWDGQYDLTYITGIPAPTNYAFERKGLEYRPEGHFSNFVHVWKTCNIKELGAVPPEVMTEVALKNEANRKVVHYVQPHAPYIGEYRLRDSNTGTEWGDSLQDIYTKIGRYDNKSKTISDEELRKAYGSNLYRVLNSVRDLAVRVDMPVIITADHGEFLGEGNRYIHGGSRHPILCQVPWFSVEDSILGTEAKIKADAEATVEQEQSEIRQRDVEDQLEKLGYL